MSSLCLLHPPRPAIAIVGSRTFPHLRWIWRYVATLPPNALLVSGGARGVDAAAAAAARHRGLTVLEYLPDWRRFGRRAGLLRNHQIVRRCHRLVAFWDGTSPGTRHSLDLARRLGRPTLIYRSSPGPSPHPQPEIKREKG